MRKRSTYMTYVKHNASKNGAKEKEQPGTPEAAEPREKTGYPSDYGRYYWCVKTDLSENGEILVYADEVRYTPNGGVLFLGSYLGKHEEVEGARITLGLAAGQWSTVYAASCLNGGAVAV